MGRSEAEEDIVTARRWAWTVLEKVAYIDAGRRSPVVVFRSGEQMDRREMVHGTYSRRVLRALNADVTRLHAVSTGARQRYAQLTATGALDPRHEAYRVAADLADTAEQIVLTGGLPPDAGPAAREAVMAEADLWLAHLETAGWRRRARWVRLRRRWTLALDLATRR
jgi:hypothetical protein